MSAQFRIETRRLQLRRLRKSDAALILELVNDPDWLRYIGDRGVHDLDSARTWIESGPLASYRRHGFGLNRVARKSDSAAIGICGLLQRDDLDSPDLGFALLPAFRGQGYARDAASAVIDEARDAASELSHLYAFLTPDSRPSRKLLHKLGFVRDGDYRPRDATAALHLYRIEL